MPMGSPIGMGEPIDELTGTGEPMYSPMGEPIDQFYSSYN